MATRAPIRPHSPLDHLVWSETNIMEISMITNQINSESERLTNSPKCAGRQIWGTGGGGAEMLTPLPDPGMWGELLIGIEGSVTSLVGDLRSVTPMGTSVGSKSD